MEVCRSAYNILPVKGTEWDENNEPRNRGGPTSPAARKISARLTSVCNNVREKTVATFDTAGVSADWYTCALDVPVFLSPPVWVP